MFEPTATPRHWLASRPRWAYALVAAGVVALLVLLASVSSGGAPSPARTAELIDQSYSVSGTRCRPAPHGRDLCLLDSPGCHGSLLVAPTSSGTITVIVATPPDLTSEHCGKTEGAAAEGG
jgi:hypothetical protein